MKKFLIASGVAVLAFATVASAQSMAFPTSDLTVGSTGAEVTALQHALMSAGYDIPALSSGAANYGYFGSQTKAAVAKLQEDKGVVNPGTGYYGPLTRAAINNGAGSTGGSAMNPSTCPIAGWIPATYNGVAFCLPPGYAAPVGSNQVANNNQGTTGGITTPGVAGSVDLSNGTYVGNGTSVNDGQSVDIASIGLQTGASDMQVTSASIDFNVRPWLYMTSLSLVDTNGNTLATINNLNRDNFSEITVGSDYRLTIPVNFVIPATTKKIVVLHGVFGTSNRDGLNIYVSQVQVRAVDGTGVSVTSTLGSGSAPTGLGLYVAYGGQNSSSILVSLDGSSPQNGNNIQTNSGNTQTKDVTLAVYKFKSQNVDSTLQGLTVNILTEPLKAAAIFGNIQLMNGSTLLSSGTIGTETASGTAPVTFSNFNMNLPADTYTPLTIRGTVQGGVDGQTASTSLVASASNITGIDTSSNPLTVSTSGTVYGSALNFTLNGVNASDLAVTPSAPTTYQGANGVVSATQKFTWTLHAGNTDLYVSKTPSLAIATSSGASTATSSNLTGMTASTGSYVDTATDYSVPAGNSRTFSVNVNLSDLGGTTAAGAVSTYATALYYSASTPVTSGNVSSITASLDPLRMDTTLTSTN